MQVNIHAPYKDRVQQALGDPNLRIAVSKATDRMTNARLASMGAVEGQQLRSQVRKMKEHVLSNWPDYLEQLEANLTRNGCTVHWAEGVDDAQAIVKDIALQNSANLVVKSKSMATEEIHLNHALEDAGLRVVETDLGEYIIQLADEPPSHIVAPVIHKRLEEIAEVLQDKLDMPPTARTHQDDLSGPRSVARGVLLRRHGRQRLQLRHRRNPAPSASSPTKATGRMVSSMPRVYVAVMGIEKLVPTVEDAFLQLQALCRSATGQQLTVYCSMTSGPRQEGDVDGPEQVHVVLLDNGRSRMLARGYGEALLCIRCGACLNACPVYQEIGGHAYGGTYNGPIGAVISPALAPRNRQVQRAAPRHLPLRRLPRGLPRQDRPAPPSPRPARRSRAGRRPAQARSLGH